MLTLTPVVCMLSAIAFSNVFEHYLGDDTQRENPPVEDSSDEDDKRNSGNLYDKVRKRDTDEYVSMIPLDASFCQVPAVKLLKLSLLPARQLWICQHLWSFYNSRSALVLGLKEARLFF